MSQIPSSWLIVNERSGSSGAESIRNLEDLLDQHEMRCDRVLRLPDDDLPDAATLDAAGVEQLVLHTGDGTANAALHALAGWAGEILVLPGGTMNLLSGRLHGEGATREEIVARVARGASRPVRISVVRSEVGDAFAGFLAGPGATWANVREAMRDVDIARIAQEAGEAVAETTGGARVRLMQPQCGRESGYPLIELTPSARGLQVDAYCADDLAGYVQQGWALLRRQFREGPHERLGLFDEISIANVDGEPIKVLLDGEPKTLGSTARIQIAQFEADLLATDHGF
ncbi:acylglycerol kinase family protein [Qipengyuania sp. XHP0207]|uniref:acylglycerol kinase family protein n=1 Tax=Qipengyuania sp. XHP0207 TaxID=3038078 RepID=UPI00241F1760|nr:acylglycerol kinase family protein [Qipengyuania sp. XHP0207]MDG5748053.1 acylglycerol kinase family protein [Qipengyuania sp. XHP0207]